MKDVRPDLLKDGDSYFCVVARQKSANNDSNGKLSDTNETNSETGSVASLGIPAESDSLCLVLRHMTDGHVTEHPVWECDYKNLFIMDFIQNVNRSNSEDLALMLDHCIVAVEKSEPMKWISTRLPTQVGMSCSQNSCRSPELDTPSDRHNSVDIKHHNSYRQCNGNAGLDSVDSTCNMDINTHAVKHVTSYHGNGSQGTPKRAQRKRGKVIGMQCSISYFF